MLQLLHIENVAVIERADVEFTGGLNVLTGETGAGKSIVIDAMNAILGGKTSKELIRRGAENALVTAVFTGDAALRWCEEAGLDAEEGEVIISRKISPDGRSTSRVNGNPVPLAQLRELGARLLDIHGQNDGQRLLDERFHRRYLDGYGKLQKELSEYQAAYEALKETKKAVDALSMDEGAKERRMDTLRYQIAELEKADIKPGEVEEKTARRDFLRSIGKITDAVNEAYFAMYGGDRNDGAATLIEEAEGALTGALRYSETLTGITEKLRQLRYDAEDVTEELRDLRESMDVTPGELDELESRLELLRRLSRKYGGDETALLAFLEECREELDNMEFAGEKLEKLNAEMKKRHKAAVEAAMILRKARKEAALRLGKELQNELSHLSMKGTRFEVEFTELSEPGPEGMDEVRFLMSANAGEVPGRISRIASGGELSRIMLAMKSVLSESDEIGTMVFDEIDTGVSGIAAQRVGEKLSALAGKKQVLCVTHLPQIAAMADNHFCVEKNQRDGRTFTDVRTLDGEGRRQEIARLTGGDNVTELTLSAAGEQIAAADAWKRQNRAENH
ncbi:MAG: DNA repair protein RecN [Oscillospiraceae bacterium]|nr:DNA repair protein RecN [Oscillospiraceae bacterium]